MATRQPTKRNLGHKQQCLSVEIRQCPLTPTSNLAPSMDDDALSMETPFVLTDSRAPEQILIATCRTVPFLAAISPIPVLMLTPWVFEFVSRGINEVCL
jgi:hypothetical protein